MTTYRRRLPEGTEPERVLAAVAEAAEVWGAEWQEEVGGGRLRLPVAAGLRRGVLVGRLDARGAEDLVFTVDETHLAVHGPSLGMLLLAAGGALATVVGPFFVHRYPTLLAIAPLAIMLAVGGWFVVAANQRLAGAEEFLGLIEEMVSEPPAEEPAQG